MNSARRQFFSHLAQGAGVLALAGTGMELGGCSLGSVWAQIQAWVPAGIAAFESVVTLVAPLAAPGIDTIATTVQAGFAALAAAVNQYLNAPAASKATLEQKVLLIFSQLQGDLQAFLSAVNVAGTNPIVKIVLGLISIIVSTITGFLGQIGTPPVTPASLTLGGSTIAITPASRNRAQFVKDFNAACVAAGHLELEIH